MEQQNNLGIYISENSATAVVLSSHGHKVALLGSFSVTVEETKDDQPQKSLGRLIAEGLSARELNFSHASVAVDCKLFRQHDLHSEFSDHKQIAQTIRFDAEEAVATDTTNLAITFNILDVNKNGSELAIYTAQSDKLARIINDIDANGIDPIFMEPDCVCLARFFSKNIKLPESINPLFGVASRNSCYFIHSCDSQHSPKVRSFLLNPSQDKTKVLTREIPITLAGQNKNKPISSMFIASDDDDVDIDLLSERTGLDIEGIDLYQTAGTDDSKMGDCLSKCEFAIAYGAAMAGKEWSVQTDFRPDFMPYKGRRIIMEKCLRLSSIFLTIAMIALTAMFVFDIKIDKNYISELTAKGMTDFKAVMHGKLKSKQSIKKRLQNEVIKAMDAQEGMGDATSVDGKLTYLFDTLSSLPETVDIKVDRIKINAKTITLFGSTNSRASTLKMISEIDKSKKLKVKPEQTLTKAERDNFTIYLEIKE